METDRLILFTEKAICGDASAFSELYALYARELYRFALYYLRNTDDAEDAVQDAVLAAYKSIGSLRDGTKFKAWLFRILANTCKKRLLSHTSLTMSETPVEEFYDLAGDESVEFSTALGVRQALDTLPERDRSIVLLSVIGGYNSSEIGDMLGIRPSSVRSILSRSLQKLRGQLE